MERFDAELWREAFRLLDAALDLPPDERASWLTAPGSAQSRLPAALRELLARQLGNETRDFLAELPRFTRADAGELLDAAPGDLVGPWRLLREIGRGGMGMVWLAERADGQFGRNVALKLPRVSAGGRLADGLIRERHIQAAFEHPNIARLYDAGVDARGRPFIAMEYIDGRPVDQYCAEEQPSLDARLNLIVDAARAVAFAHSKLVVHRDLKPSNLLVTRDGAVHLLDFGIARLLGDEEHELRALTPRYAAPEQLRGEDAGTSADQYSLAVVASQLFDGVALPADLAAILEKARAPRPDDRYATVDAFAQDIARFQAKLPVQARPATRRRRAALFFARHRTASIAGLVVLLAVVSGAGVAAWQAREARLQARHAEQIKSFILSIFNDADVDAGGSRVSTAADLLGQARRRVDAELADDAPARVELLTSVGFGLLGLSEFDAGRDTLAEAVDLGRRQLGADHPLTLAAKVRLAEALVDTGRQAEANELLLSSLAALERNGDTHLRVEALRWLSDLRLYEGKFDAAVSYAERAVRAAESPGAGDRDLLHALSSLEYAMLAAKRPHRLPVAQRALALARAEYGDKPALTLLIARRAHARAVADEQDAEAGARELAAIVPEMVKLVGREHQQVGVTLQLLSAVLLRIGDVDGAVRTLREDIAIEDALHANEANTSGAVSRASLAWVLICGRRYPEAEAAIGEAEPMVRGLFPSGSLNARVLRKRRADILLAQGKLAEAEALLAPLDANPEVSGLEKSLVEQTLGTLRSRQGRHDDARRLLEDAVTRARAGGDALPVARMSVSLGLARIAAGDAAGALEPLREAVGTFRDLHRRGSVERTEAEAALEQARRLAAVR